MRIELFKYDFVLGFFVKCFIAQTKQIKNVKIYTN